MTRHTPHGIGETASTINMIPVLPEAGYDPYNSIDSRAYMSLDAWRYESARLERVRNLRAECALLRVQAG